MNEQLDILCPHPWIMYKGICLLYFYAQRSWKEAEDLCFSQGGALPWNNNVHEHSIIADHNWVRNIRYYHNFWIGLFKKMMGVFNGAEDLVWVLTAENLFKKEEKEFFWQFPIQKVFWSEK